MNTADILDKIVEGIVDLQADMKEVKRDLSTTRADIREIKDNVEGFVKIHTTLECEVVALHSRVGHAEGRLEPIEKALKLKTA